MPSGSARAILDDAGEVYSAARAVCADPELAEAIAERVLIGAARSSCGDRLDRARLVEEALVLGVRVDPCAPFAALPPEEREVIVLARLGGLSVHGIALALEMSIESVKSAMCAGLTRLTDAREHAGAV